MATILCDDPISALGTQNTASKRIVQEHLTNGNINK